MYVFAENPGAVAGVATISVSASMAENKVEVHPLAGDKYIAISDMSGPHFGWMEFGGGQGKWMLSDMSNAYQLTVMKAGEAAETQSKTNMYVVTANFSND